jgi:hypothetical protein
MATETKPTAPTKDVAIIEPANMVRITVRIRGTAPLVMNRFSKKGEIMAGMATPKAEKKSKTARPPRDYDADYEGAFHKTSAGWYGLPASGLRQGLIDACRTVNLVMTRAKMAVFVIADGFDEKDGTPLVRLQSPKPAERTEMVVRNDNGSVDIRIRPMWREWSAVITLEFDADMITAQSVVNLLDRVGRQVGVCEGRPFSKNSAGMGWGTFTVESTVKESAA